ncbi:MAG: lysylphosphatidylglycerol synthase domain-containing protein [Alphaproteobacteria bacterium]
MRILAPVAICLGLALAIGLIVYNGAGDVAGAIAAASWGIVLVVLVRLVPIMADGCLWRLLFPRAERPPVPLLLWTRWIGEAVNTLLPGLQVGGALVRTRLLVLRGIPGRYAGASVVVDLTLSTLTQLLFTLIGIGFLVARYGDSGFARGAAIGVFVGLLLLGGFYFTQRRGLFRALAGIFSRMARGRAWVSAVGGAAALDDAIREVYRQPWSVLGNASGQLVAWMLGAAEIWLALYFMGHPVTIADALLLESLVLAVRAAAFIVPGAVGVQEGALMLLGSVVGLPPEIALGLSLVKRLREIALGVPALMVWQVVEGHRLFSRRSRPAPAPAAAPAPEPLPGMAAMPQNESRQEAG